jgi:NADH-quinone oxidoreductase subunit J
MLFYLFGAIAIAASLLVIAQRKPIYSVLLLIASFGALSGLYVLLDAPFVAVIQIIIYAGAIMVLFLFVVMLLHASQEDPEGAVDDAGLGSRAIVSAPLAVRFGAWLAVALGCQLVWAFSVARESGDFAGGSVSSVAEIGRLLFTEYAFAFEVTSLLILVAMVGAVVLARREDRPADRRAGTGGGR